jgi:hypothetical protein
LPRKRVEVAVSFVLVAIVVFFLWESRDWQVRARLAPWTVGFIVLAISLMQLFVASRALLRASSTSDPVVNPVPSGGHEPRPSGGQAAISGTPAMVQTEAADQGTPEDDAMVRSKALFMIAWTVGFCLGLWLLGFRLGAPLLTFGFLRFGAGESSRMSAMFALGAYVSIVLLFQAVVGLPFPPGMLFEAAGLQSPDMYVVDAALAAIRGREEG